MFMKIRRVLGLLNELDKEDGSKGLDFVCYADYTEVETMPKSA